MSPYFLPERVNHFWFPSRNHTYIAGQRCENLIVIQADVPSSGDGFQAWRGSLGRLVSLSFCVGNEPSASGTCSATTETECRPAATTRRQSSVVFDTADNMAIGHEQIQFGETFEFCQKVQFCQIVKGFVKRFLKIVVYGILYVNVELTIQNKPRKN